MTPIDELVKRLRNHALGPEICPACGRNRADPETWTCKSEGQCDFIRHNGTHTSAIDDPWKFKENALEAADALLAEREAREKAERERDDAAETELARLRKRLRVLEEQQMEGPNR